RRSIRHTSLGAGARRSGLGTDVFLRTRRQGCDRSAGVERVRRRVTVRWSLKSAFPSTILPHHRCLKPGREKTAMKVAFRLMFGFTILCLAAPCPQAQMTPESQAQPQTHEPSPREVVERLWSMAIQGNLLQQGEAKRASWLFTQPVEPPKAKKFIVMSNSYWVDRPRFQGTTARVVVWYDEIGSID